MKCITRSLSTYGKLTGYLHEPSPEFPNITTRPAILVLPGGGFRVCSDREAEPVAMAYYAQGYQAFVLRYSLATDSKDVRMENCMQDVCLAMEYIRTEPSLLVSPGKLALLGFSGGGHLAAAVSTHCPEKPDRLLLGYPGIVHSDLRALDCPDIPECVDVHTPQTFLFGMHGDPVTPPIHILSFACALNKVGVPFELHLFQGSGHGLSLGTPLTASGNADHLNPDYASWFPMSLRWLEKAFGTFPVYGANDGRNGRLPIDRP